MIIVPDPEQNDLALFHSNHLAQIFLSSLLGMADLLSGETAAIVPAIVAEIACRAVLCKPLS